MSISGQSSHTQPFIYFCVRLTSWNKIPKLFLFSFILERGRPVDFVQNSETLPVTDQVLLDGDDAADRYRIDGGTFTDEQDAAGDLLAHYPDIQNRRDQVYWNHEIRELRRRILARNIRYLPPEFVEPFRNKSAIELFFVLVITE